ncbi:hypothetical protein L5515_019494 [Caenorhabditis briggsae]|uniref:Uncharacterized protein n=1 Tax=Caenorhabditis briggsae TaxID=6238 RepID=A0AAE9JU64_CAEBR|nr:hypothetical protein L5515_019494 [Caenorhabditis briggsae]
MNARTKFEIESKIGKIRVAPQHRHDGKGKDQGVKIDSSRADALLNRCQYRIAVTPKPNRVSPMDPDPAPMSNNSRRPRSQESRLRSSEESYEKEEIDQEKEYGKDASITKNVRS